MLLAIMLSRGRWFAGQDDSIFDGRKASPSVSVCWHPSCFGLPFSLSRCTALRVLPFAVSMDFGRGRKFAMAYRGLEDSSVGMSTVLWPQLPRPFRLEPMPHEVGATKAER